MIPSSPFLPTLLHQQYLARGRLMALPQPNPATPPSSEDNMSPPPALDFRTDEEDKQVEIIIRPFLISFILCPSFTHIFHFLSVLYSYLSFHIRPSLISFISYPSFTHIFHFLSVLYSYLSFIIRPLLISFISYPSFTHIFHFLSVLYSYLSFLILPLLITFISYPFFTHIFQFLSVLYFYLSFLICPLLTFLISCVVLLFSILFRPTIITPSSS